MTLRRRSFLLLGLVAPWWLMAGCRPSAPPASNRVVLYCSVDDVYARPIIRDLEKRTGLRIDVLYDTEAAKTAGLASRIRAERQRPRGDVFWSSALLQTLLLEREGLLQPYPSPAARRIPKQFKDARGLWTGMGVRRRLIVHHRGVDAAPRSLEDLLSARFKNKVGISNPQFGTASDWTAALAVRWGLPKTLHYFRALKKNGVRVLPGNSVVAERVARGELLAGITDTDDFLAQARKSSDIKASVIAEPAAINSVVVPGSVALFKGAPHREAARRLLDALLDEKTERQLVQIMPGVSATRGLPQKPTGGTILPFSTAPDDAARWPAAWDAVREPLAQILLAD